MRSSTAPIRSKVIKNGFTLLELLIVIAMLSLVMVFIMPNIRNIRDEQTLSSTALEFQSNLRSAQNNALSGGKCSLSDQSAVDWHFVLIDKERYKVEATCLTGTSPTKEYSLVPFGVEVENVSSCSNVADAGVYFSNVSGVVTFAPPSGCTLTDKIEFVLRMSQNSSVSPRKVTVDQGGRIYVSEN